MLLIGQLEKDYRKFRSGDMTLKDERKAERPFNYGITVKYL